MDPKIESAKRSVTNRISLCVISSKQIDDTAGVTSFRIENNISMEYNPAFYLVLFGYVPNREELGREGWGEGD